MAVIATAAGIALAALGTAMMARAQWQHLKATPPDLPWYRAWFHPNDWVQPYDSHFVRGAVLLVVGILLLTV